VYFADIERKPFITVNDEGLLLETSPNYTHLPVHNIYIFEIPLKG
jgi:hypothetical protein